MTFTTDYRDYLTNLNKYSELSSSDFSSCLDKKDVMERLKDIANSEAKIRDANNMIIDEYITAFEENRALLTDETVAILQNFLDDLCPFSHYPYDVFTASRLSDLLLDYYYENYADPETIIHIANQRSVLSITFANYQKDYNNLKCSIFIDEYLDCFDSMSKAAKECFIGIYRRSLLEQGYDIEAFRQYLSFRDFVKNKQRLFPDMDNADLMLDLACRDMLMTVNEQFRIRKYNEQNGLDGPLYTELDLCSDELRKFSSEIRERLNTGKYLPRERVFAYICAPLMSFNLGDISLYELEHEMNQICDIDSFTEAEQIEALLYANTVTIEYLKMYSKLDSKSLSQRISEIVNTVINVIDNIDRNFDYLNAYPFLYFITHAAEYSDLDSYKDKLLELTIYKDPNLLIHTKLVQRICLVLAETMLEQTPYFFTGVCGLSQTDILNGKNKIMSLIDESALFHDIGIHNCLEITSNNYRSLTEEEFKLIKKHPSNSASLCVGPNNPRIECIRDCALLHHKWHNNINGYPESPHTKNKPLVDIISVADAIEAATDYIGRTYSKAKDLDSLINELDELKDRYNPKVVELLHDSVVYDRINRIIHDDREEITYNAYVGY